MLLVLDRCRGQLSLMPPQDSNTRSKAGNVLGWAPWAGWPGERQTVRGALWRDPREGYIPTLA
jgi:hypothetical protein